MKNQSIGPRIDSSTLRTNDCLHVHGAPVSDGDDADADPALAEALSSLETVAEQDVGQCVEDGRGDQHAGGPDAESGQCRGTMDQHGAIDKREHRHRDD